VSDRTFMPGKKKFTLALIATGVTVALTVYLTQTGTPARDAVTIALVAVASLWGFIGIEGGRDIVRERKDSQEGSDRP